MNDELRKVRAALFTLLGVTLLGACAVESETPSGGTHSTQSSAGAAATGGVATGGAATAAGGAGATGGATGAGGAVSSAGSGALGGSAGSSVGAAGSLGVSGGSGGLPATGACATVLQADGSVPLIDDLNHAGKSIPSNESRSGVWDVWTKSAGSDMSPASGMFEPEGVDGGDGFVHWTGTALGGANDWGPTLTVQLGAGCPYDASVYSGISFKLKGTFTKQSSAGTTTGLLKVMLWQPAGVPPSDAVGGKCTAIACYNHFSTFVTIPSSWDAPVVVTFASLTQGSWTGTMPFLWNPAELIAVQFQLEVDGSKSELATFDVSLDDLAFTHP